MAGFATGDIFGRAVRDDVTAFVTGLGPEINDPIGAFDNVEVVLDDEHRMTGIDETLKSFQQNADVVKVQAGGRFVEKKQGRTGVPPVLSDFRPRSGRYRLN